MVGLVSALFSSRDAFANATAGASHSHQRRQPACLLSGNARSLCRQSHLVRCMLRRVAAEAIDFPASIIGHLPHRASSYVGSMHAARAHNWPVILARKGGPSRWCAVLLRSPSGCFGEQDILSVFGRDLPMHSQSSQLDSAPAGASHNGCATSLLRDLDVFLQPCCVGSSSLPSCFLSRDVRQGRVCLPEPCWILHSLAGKPVVRHQKPAAGSGRLRGAPKAFLQGGYAGLVQVLRTPDKGRDAG
mmetsp:Transcript_20980/g.49155  ORF Transcript_20980/g.49155 Transcript_20980/m.49155 type:complete len:245 (-) Transcript_20980:3032-3766(-)